MGLDFRSFCLVTLLMWVACAQSVGARPNVVVIMGDDWSWPHASILGDKTVKTPNFDRIATEGILFENAFATAPSCTPSRHVVASGQYHWRLGEGVNLGGSIPADAPVYPDLLAKAGYVTGHCRKGTAPSQNRFRGNDPFGPRHRDFDSFMAGVDQGQSFCFWYGAGEPHRPYDWNESQRRGMDLDSIEVPPFLPDNREVRTDLGDYYLRVEKLDLLAGKILDRLEQRDVLEDTIVVMTGDHGMPFPRAKATLYDSGTRVPLAIRWGNHVEKGRRRQGMVSLMDLAPTLLEACGLSVPQSMTGRSLLSAISSKQGKPVQKDTDYLLFGMERHVYPNPSRAIRTADHLYIRNYAPESWPTGKPRGTEALFDFSKTPWPTVKGAFSYNVDPGPTKQWMRLNECVQNQQAFGKREAEELYDVRRDSFQLTNLVSTSVAYLPESVTKVRKELAKKLTAQLRASGDPRHVRPEHATLEVRGWTVHLNEVLWIDSPLETKTMLGLLDGQLKRVAETVPPTALKLLREIPIWINPQYEGVRPRAEYHPEEGWLRANKRNPEMVHAVEITNVSIFPFENRRMPFLLLHELAHGFHHRWLEAGNENPEILKLYNRAVSSGTYDEVQRFDGRKMVRDKAYAMNTPMEYFAESTEAYFGRNDFFPFDREELSKHDPAMHDLVGRLWNEVSPGKGGESGENMPSRQ